MIAHSQYLKSKRISIFLSMPDEIETEEIIRDIFQQGKTCFIPRYQFQSNHMDMVKLASPEEISSLPKTSWNIHQPGENEIREEALSTGECYGIRISILGWCQAVMDYYTSDLLVMVGSVWVTFSTALNLYFTHLPRHPLIWLKVRCPLYAVKCQV